MRMRMRRMIMIEIYNGTLFGTNPLGVKPMLYMNCPMGNCYFEVDFMIVFSLGTLKFSQIGPS